MVKNQKRETLTRNLLQPLILSILESKPMHGYMVIQTIKSRHGVEFAGSTVYPILEQFERDKLVSTTTETSLNRLRIIYHLSAKGQRDLNEYRLEIQQLMNLVVKSMKPIVEMQVAEPILV